MNLTKLFIGAPVVIEAKGICGITRLSDGNALVNWNKSLDTIIRLPTIAESPRNIWLTPWEEMPNDLITHIVYLRVDKYHIVPLDDYFLRHLYSWDNVEALMITDKL